MVMRVIIVGAGVTGQELAERLAQRHPVLLVDKDFASSEAIEPEAAGVGGACGLVRVRGDGTSRLVLDALIDPQLQSALLAVTGSDEVNLEVGRLGRAIAYEPVIAVQHHPTRARQYADEGITALARADLVADHLERSLRHQGAVVPSGIGLGKGELVEIRLVKTSPILGRPLSDLAPRRWRIAAIFRNDQLIVPAGDTELIIDDRVLLVGDPRFLPTVAEHLRLGKPRFPRSYGPNVVTLEITGPDQELAEEADSLATWSTASHLVRGLPGVANTLPAQETEPLTRPEGTEHAEHSTFAPVGLDDPRFADLVAAQRPGIIVVRPYCRGPLARLGGRQGPDARLGDLAAVPVLYARGSFPYQRVLMTVSSSELNLHAAHLAIDIVRQLRASLTVINVDLPRFISGLTEEAQHHEVIPIRRMCELFDVRIDYCHRQGNPIREVLAEAAKHDLLVVVRRKKRRDNYFDPDVALRLARSAPCSVLVLTASEGGWD